MQPFQGFTSWAAFAGSGTKDGRHGRTLTLTEKEVSPAMDAALGSGLEVTALHNHFSFGPPARAFMHVAGTGTTDQLTTAVRKVLDAIRRHGTGRATASTVRASRPRQHRPEAAGGHPRTSAQAKDGMAKFVFGKKTKAHGLDLGPEMESPRGQPLPQPGGRVVMRLAMTEAELQPVLKTLRAARIDVVAIHSQHDARGAAHHVPPLLGGKGTAD